MPRKCRYTEECVVLLGNKQSNKELLERLEIKGISRKNKETADKHISATLKDITLL